VHKGFIVSAIRNTVPSIGYKLLGITPDAFRIGAEALLFLSAVSLVQTNLTTLLDINKAALMNLSINKD
jgi:small neutral amino acid transporter SnatA (MarC family)